MEGSNNNWEALLKGMGIEVGSPPAAANEYLNQPPVSPFFTASPSIYSPYVCSTPQLSNNLFFGAGFSGSFESVSEPVTGSGLPPNGFPDNSNAFAGRDLNSENNEACFFGSAFRNVFEQESHSKGSSSGSGRLFERRQCASPFVYSPRYSDRSLVSGGGIDVGKQGMEGDHGQAFFFGSEFNPSLESVLDAPPSNVNDRDGCHCCALPPMRSGVVEGHEEVSRKVFVGGIPAGTNIDILESNFSKFGDVQIDWPKKGVGSCVPPEGYIFAIYANETSVLELLQNCCKKEKRVVFQLQISPTQFSPVEVKAWEVKHAYYVGNPGWRRFRRLSVFAGGLPRTCTAEHLAFAIEGMIGPVAYCSIEQDKFTRYPKGAAQIVFSTQESYIKAIAAHDIFLRFQEGNRKIELKPFLFPNMPCEKCGIRTNTKFCRDFLCLSYFCDGCWKMVHDRRMGMLNHEASRRVYGRNNF